MRDPKATTFLIDLGAKVIDSITGFSGTVTGRAQYIAGCNQYSVMPKMETGKVECPDAIWIDEARLEVTQDGKGVLGGNGARETPTGGPQRNPAPAK